MRNPARTAITSAALMVGLGLVVFVAVFAAGAEVDLHRRPARRAGQGRLVVYSPRPSTPIPARHRARDRRRAAALRTAQQYSSTRSRSTARSPTRSTTTLTGVDPREPARRLHVRLDRTATTRWSAGWAATQALIEEQFAKAHASGSATATAWSRRPAGTRRMRAIGDLPRPDDPAGHDRRRRERCGRSRTPRDPLRLLRRRGRLGRPRAGSGPA